VEVVYTKPPWERVRVPEGLPYRVHWAPFLGLRSVRHASFRPLNGFPVARLVRRLLRERAGSPTVLHGNGEEASLLGRVRGEGVGLVVSPHYGMVPEAYLRGEPTWRGRLGVLLREPRYVALGPALRAADVCCPPSAFVARLVRQAYRLPEARVRPIPGGVSAPFLEAPARPHDPAGPVVYAGRFTRIRGVDLLLDAAERLGGEGARFVLVGRAERDPALQQRIERLTARGALEVRPWLPQGELAVLFAQASAVAVPSRYESFGLAAAEAMACGAPVVAAAAGALPELIEHGRTGLLVPPEDAAALAEALRGLRASPERAAALGEAARSAVRARYSWDATAAAYETVYEEAVRSASRSRSPTIAHV